MTKIHYVLGIAGLFPFYGMILLYLSGTIEIYRAALHFIQYSAVLLSFFGGIHWLDAVQNKRKNHQLYVAMVPTIIGWLALVIGNDPRVLAALSVCYIGVLFYDKYNLALEKSLIIPYITLRVTLTSAVVVAHAWLIILLTQ